MFFIIFVFNSRDEINIMMEKKLDLERRIEVRNFQNLIKYTNTKIQNTKNKFLIILILKSIFRLIMVSVIIAPSTVCLYQLLEYRNFFIKTPLLEFY